MVSTERQQHILHYDIYHLVTDYLKNYVTRGQTVTLIGEKWKLEAFGIKSLVFMRAERIMQYCHKLCTQSHNEQFSDSPKLASGH